MEDAQTVARITKVKEDGTPLAGATLQLLSGETVVDEWVSTAEAHVLTGLKAGEYTLHETEAHRYG